MSQSVHLPSGVHWVQWSIEVQAAHSPSFIKYESSQEVQPLAVH